MSACSIRPEVRTHRNRASCDCSSASDLTGSDLAVDSRLSAHLITRAYLGKLGITLCASYSNPNSGDNLTGDDVSLEEALRDFAAEQDQDL